MNAWYIGLGGILGALLRYTAGLAVPQGEPGSFPLATFLCNLTGCLALGWLLHAEPGRVRLPPQLRAAVGTGVIGSFTTFSAFSLEMVELVHRGAWGTAAAYGLGSLWGGLALAALGARLAPKSTPAPGGQEGAQP